MRSKVVKYMGMQKMVITLILYAASFLPRDISTTGISLISSFEVVCKKAFLFARDCLCVLRSMPEHIWKAKCVFQGHFRSQSIHTTHSCSACTTFTLPAPKKPLLPKSRGTIWILSSLHAWSVWLTTAGASPHSLCSLPIIAPQRARSKVQELKLPDVQI